MVLIAAIYAVLSAFVPESKDIGGTEEIAFPPEKVFPQFSDFQNFVKWNSFFVSKAKVKYLFYTPYTGMGSSMSYAASDESGDLSIIYENPMHSLRYRWYTGKNSAPYIINLKFKRSRQGSTRITWAVNAPKQALLNRILGLLDENKPAHNFGTGMQNLTSILGSKVDREKLLNNLKFDSIFVESQPAKLLLGVNVSTSNKKDNLFKNVILNHNKVVNYVRLDLGKKEDEFGIPVLISDPANIKGSDISYFYGVPLSKKIPVTDNNFSFKSIAASKCYVVYFKGNYFSRTKAVQQLLLKAKRDSMQNGELQEWFLQEPSEKKDVLMKISLPVVR